MDDDYDPRVPVGALHSGPHHPQEGHDGGDDALEHAVRGFCLHPLCATLLLEVETQQEEDTELHKQ